ncbi:MAG: hypothetical protein COV55_03750 [Candidatus Komeilibacteria bacterium CG11_big_fil_rev_8_21_14_0_20_36_20]|uniref:Uncharacterized protein n=1 Tax=Candidatus Komeilibacteria bacterium CG11_big_fil_rev_8_21_14_0_20_36_20 TaxID=1974477 RepID=A0A2H0NCJ0_9BACT|nr:MAG: hypothetical protein COV55_03750 [Candidatus Komeilibacteria bacterium CG11_big_fil_rev_8_21_14_0_20_36_20]PIR81944.1 MAG: hypothetical protein COU21_01195 [Candidatus Komeilibacteria bacterium CG10_big_fil_rev_8_21_14_0_10_36_65]PJC55476.1 MAG: hypothetical protein CO027_01875 [Candidatus Komeilibacteria bacterium CG_4_9_14_0_2_um_filter_36_13]
MKQKSNLIFLSLFFLLVTKTAHAYLDPGSGSFIFQIIIAGLLSGAFAIKMYFKKIKKLFTRIFNRKKTDYEEEHKETP